MTAADIWAFTVPYIDALSPVVLVFAIVALGGQLVDFIEDIARRL